MRIQSFLLPLQLIIYYYYPNKDARSYLTQEPYRHSNGIRLHFGDKEAFFRTKILHHGGATTNPQEYQQEKST